MSAEEEFRFRRSCVKGSLFLGDFVADSRALGPGRRSGIWVRGCPFRCAGCMTPEFLAYGRPEHRVSIETLFSRVIEASERYRTEGVTLSGGEPFGQAEALGELAESVREKGLSVIVWTGYRYEWISRQAGARKLFANTDVLIDGPFMRERASALSMRGSSNQSLHFLTDRYGPEDFRERKAEIRFKTGKGELTGVGPAGEEFFRAVADLLLLR